MRDEDLVGQIVVLLRPLRTVGGVRHRKGDRYRVETAWRGRFNLVGITEAGSDRRAHGYNSHAIRAVSRSVFELEKPSSCEP